MATDIIAIRRKQIGGEALTQEDLRVLAEYENSMQAETEKEKEVAAVALELDDSGPVFGGNSSFDVTPVRVSSGEWESDAQYEKRMGDTRELLLNKGSWLAFGDGAESSAELPVGDDGDEVGTSKGVAKVAVGMAAVIGGGANHRATGNVAAAITNVIHYDVIRQENKRLKDGNIHKSKEVKKYADEQAGEVLRGLFVRGRGDSTAVAKVAGAVANVFYSFPDEAKEGYEYFNSEEAREIVAESLLNADKSSDIGNFCRIMGVCHRDFGEKSFLSRGDLVDKILESYDDLGTRSMADALAFLRDSLEDSVSKGTEGADIADKIASEEFLNKILDGVDSSNKENPGQNSFYEEMALNMSLEILKDRPDLVAGEVGDRVRDAIVDFSERAQGRRGVQNCCSLMNKACGISGGKEGGDEGELPLLSDEKARDLFVDMGQRVEEPRDIAFVCNSFAKATFRLGKKSEEGVFDQDRDWGFLSDMVAKAGNVRGYDGDVARGSVASVIGVLAADKKGRDVLPKSAEIHNLVIDWGNRAQSDDGIAGVAGAISQLAYQEAEQYQAPERAAGLALPLFAQNKAIEGVLDKMGEAVAEVAAPDKVGKVLNEARGNVLRGLPAARVQMSPAQVRAGIGGEEKVPVNSSGAGSSEVDRSSGGSAGDRIGAFQAVINKQREEGAKVAGGKRSVEGGASDLGSKRVKTGGPDKGQSWKEFVGSRGGGDSGRGGGAGPR